MAHSPEHPKRFVCAGCQVLYAGTPVRREDGGHVFEEPDECHVCDDTEFVAEADWIHHHE